MTCRRRPNNHVAQGKPKAAPRRAGAAVAHHAPRYATCDTLAEPSDNSCSECGSAFAESTPVSIASVSTPYAITAYSQKNKERIPA